MNDKTAEAYAYLEAARTGLARTNDTTATYPTPLSWPNLQIQAAALEQDANKKREEAETANAAAQAKRKEAELEKAKAECAKVPEDKKAEDENCKQVAAAQSGAESG